MHEHRMSLKLNTYLYGMNKKNVLVQFLPVIFWLVLVGCQNNQNIFSESADGHVPPMMVRLPGGEFIMGSNDANAYPHEKPAHRVKVDAFYMDITEVTNSMFLTFVDSTGYVTVAERKPDWEELKLQLPPDTPKPHDTLLVPGSLTFTPPSRTVMLNDPSQWWSWTPKANWRHPEGPESNIEQRLNHPVVHIAFEDAQAYCNWMGKRLPTEAEWEFASNGGSAQPVQLNNSISSGGAYSANVFQGSFPNKNLILDGFESTAPIKSFAPNEFGLFDMIGNVWEWTSDYYHPDYYSELAGMGVATNPKGPKSSLDPAEPGITKYVTKGGSFLCNHDYCSNYRATARQASAYDTGHSHVGFRCVKDMESK